jgi:hypothetical protein
VITALEAGAGQAPGWVRLLPLGEVPLGDDREPLWVDEEALAAMVAHFRERGLDLVVDYEHQTLSGRKAPAAGWIRELEGRVDGLWARVEWTDTAREHLAAREYRYFSPVLRLEDTTRRPLALLHAALTNTPAINGLTPLVAKISSQQLAVSRQKDGRVAGDVGLAGEPGESVEPLGDLAALLGLPEEAGPSRIRGAVLALKRNLEHLWGSRKNWPRSRANSPPGWCKRKWTRPWRPVRSNPARKTARCAMPARTWRAFGALWKTPCPKPPWAASTWPRSPGRTGGPTGASPPSNSSSARVWA